MQIDKFKVEDWMNEYEKYCLYDLGNTTVNTLSLNELFEICNVEKTEFLNKLSSNILGYGDITGNEELKKHIANLYQTLTANEIVTTIGASGANHLVFYSLIEPDDEVVCVIPTYQQLYSIPKSFGANVSCLKLTNKNNFSIDIDELNSLVTSKTKLICINNPNNPTGALLEKEQLKQIIEIARKNDCYILCDEVYRGLEHNHKVFPPLQPSIADMYEKGIVTSSMSKTFSLAGVRLGWIATKNKKILSEIISHREYNMISCSILNEAISTLALTNAQKIVTRNQKTILESLEILDNWIKSQKQFSYVKPKAGTTALIYYDLQIKSAELCDRLAKEKGVFLTPGSCFGMENCFRIGYCRGINQLKTGLSKIEEFVDELVCNKI
jgi:aspartate/methionine/tyrosine aminotransferase